MEKYNVWVGIIALVVVVVVSSTKLNQLNKIIKQKERDIAESEKTVKNLQKIREKERLIFQDSIKYYKQKQDSLYKLIDDEKIKEIDNEVERYPTYSDYERYKLWSERAKRMD